MVELYSSSNFMVANYISIKLLKKRFPGPSPFTVFAFFWQSFLWFHSKPRLRVSVLPFTQPETLLIMPDKLWPHTEPIPSLEEHVLFHIELKFTCFLLSGAEYRTNFSCPSLKTLLVEDHCVFFWVSLGWFPAPSLAAGPLARLQ